MTRLIPSGASSLDKIARREADPPRRCLRRPHLLAEIHSGGISKESLFCPLVTEAVSTVSLRASFCFQFAHRRPLLLAVQRALYALGKAIRETGQALDRTGSIMQGSNAFKEQRTPSQPLCKFWSSRPL